MWLVKETGKSPEWLKSTEWEWGVDGVRLKQQAGWGQITEITLNAQGCFELGGEGWNPSVYGGILRRPHHKTRVSSF